jgi:hypothetical protein
MIHAFRATTDGLSSRYSCAKILVGQLLGNRAHRHLYPRYCLQLYAVSRSLYHPLIQQVWPRFQESGRLASLEKCPSSREGASGGVHVPAPLSPLASIALVPVHITCLNFGLVNKSSSICRCLCLCVQHLLHLATPLGGATCSRKFIKRALNCSYPWAD